MKFTPGPWEAYIENDESKLKQSYIHATRKGTKFAIGEIFATAVKGEVKANAHLIAESPTLLIAKRQYSILCSNESGDPIIWVGCCKCGQELGEIPLVRKSTRKAL